MPGGGRGHGLGGPVPSARDLLAVAAAKRGLQRRDLPCGVNLFKGVRVADGGGLHFDGERRADRWVELRAELDVLVAVANAPHPLDPRPEYQGSTVRATAWSAPRPPDDPSAPPAPNGSGPSRTPRTICSSGRRQRRRRSGRRDRRRHHPDGPARRGGAGPGGLVGRDRSRPAAAHRRPRRQPGRRFPGLRRPRPGRALQRGRHDRRPGQHLPGHRQPAAVHRGTADDDDRRLRLRLPRHDRRRLQPGVEHAALRPPHPPPARLRGQLPRRGLPPRARPSATWSPT